LVVAELVDDDATAVLVLLDVVPVLLTEFAMVGSLLAWAETTVFGAAAAVTVGATARAPVIPAKLATLATSAILRPRRARWTRRVGRIRS
jgi:hypothetical protein